MNNLTKIWQDIHTALCELKEAPDFMLELNEKMATIFSLKDIEEYQKAVLTDISSPSQFKLTREAMRRAFVEGYLVAQEEIKKDVDNVQHLYKCFKVQEGEADERQSTGCDICSDRNRSTNPVNNTSHDT